MKIQIFSAGCSLCDDAVSLVKELACPACEIEVRDMQQADVAAEAKKYSIQRVPAVIVNGKLAKCYSGNTLNEADLRAAGIGTSQ